MTSAPTSGLIIALLVGALALAGCDERGPDAPLLQCDRSLWGAEWSDDGLPPPPAAPEWIVTREIPFDRPDGHTDTTHFWLPWDVNRRQFYPLREGEDVHVRVRFMSGTAYEPDGTGHLRVFVNGWPAELRHAGELVRDAHVPLVEGLGEMTVSIPREQLQGGLNAVHLYARYDYSPRISFAHEYESIWAFSVANGGVEDVEALEDTPWTEEADADRGYWTRAFWEDEVGALRPLSRLVEGAPAGRGPFPVILRVQANPNAELCGDPATAGTFALVGLLDGERVPLGEHERIVATMTPGTQRVFRFDLELPEDGRPHVFEIVSLEGLGRPARLAGGDLYPPWATGGELISVIRWGHEASP